MRKLKHFKYNNEMKNSTLLKLQEHFQKNPKKTSKDYYVPSLWNLDLGPSHPVKVNFNEYYADVISKIVANSQNNIEYSQSLSTIQNTHSGIGGDWTYLSTIYNIYPRLTAAYDHDQDGHVGGNEKNITLDVDGIFRETGTFLKCIAMLPYIKELGVNVIHCMPITSIGKDGNRGDLGSPYAIKNQYEIDPNLAETCIPFTVEEQFKAFVEAAHILGIRVVLEFVLRTSSLGGDWIKTNPEWFYWIDKKRVGEYQSPWFPDNELAEIKKIPDGGGYHFAPNAEYRSLFKSPPKPEQIKVVKGKYVAKTDEGELVIPGAFADWPPDDIQPAWSDVTYLRMYNYPIGTPNNDYNYIAYNTIRFYDPELSKEEHVNRPLWDKIGGVIPYYQENFGIDGVMMDMGHALPKPLMAEVIHKAREIDHDFAFLEENFEIEWSSRMAGYNATLGFEWRTTGKDKGGIRNVIHKAGENLALPFFGSPETHNTPRAMQRGGQIHSQQMWAINSFLPNCIPFIHSGYELYEDYPINTGLNFTPEETAYYSDHRLGLFFKNSYNWNRQETMIPFMKKITALRNQYFGMIANGDETSLHIHYPENVFGNVVAFERFSHDSPWKSILVIANLSYDHWEKFYMKIPGTFNNHYKEYLTEKEFSFIDHWISADLAPGQVLIFELDKYLG